MPEGQGDMFKMARVPAGLRPWMVIVGLMPEASAVIVPLVDASRLNGSFENGVGNTVITDWQTGFGSGETQRLQNNAADGAWSLVIGQSPGAPNLSASVNTGHTVVAGDRFDLEFRWLPKSQWDATDQIRWRLFTTSDDSTTGTLSEISSGTVSGFVNAAGYQIESLTGITGVQAIHEGRKLWLQFLRGNSSFGEFARVDRVELSVDTNPEAAYEPLDPGYLIACHPFEQNSEDFSVISPQHDGTWVAGEAYAAGVVDAHCADLAAANVAISLPHTMTGNVTATFWIKTTSTASNGPQWWNGHGILDGSVAGVADDIGVSLNGSRIAFGAGNPDLTIFSATAVNDGEWHHVAVQRHSTSGTMRLFIDGVLEAEADGPAGERSGSSLTLGAMATGTGFLDACIDDLRIFNSTLDEASIARLCATAGNYDGDRGSDLDELIAFTDWTDAGDGIEIASWERDPDTNGFDLTIDAFAGRTYTVQRSSAPGLGWSDTGVSATPKYHGPLVLTDPDPLPERTFYRVTVSGRGHAREKRPNIVIIYGDDVGYGDVTAYNPASLISTPNIDLLASQGLRFTDAHCTASTCSPSRYSMLTGVFAFRAGITILPPTAGLAIPQDTYTMPDLLKDAGYNTAVVGKWHLGIGDGGSSIDWNGTIQPGPLELGFDYCFMIPTTNDRVPCVYLENRNIVGLDPGDPLHVHNNSYAAVNVAGSTQYPHNDASAQTYYTSSKGHNSSIINGIGRIGYMSGGQSALWDDETMAQVFLQKARDYIMAQDGETPFFLYFASQDIHVPRAPHPDFQGATTLGYRGDAMVQFDWVTGQIMQALEDAGLEEDTIVIFSSDNGPVLDDGYNDGSSNDASQGHDSSGPFSGGKYSILEGGTRVPFIVRWPAKVEPGVSGALMNQVDLMGSFAEMLEMELPGGSAADSRSALAALLGTDPVGLDFTVEQNNTGNIQALRVGDMKYTSQGMLYDLSTDIGEQTDLSGAQPSVAAAMAQQLSDIILGGGVRE